MKDLLFASSNMFSPVNRLLPPPNALEISIPNCPEIALKSPELLMDLLSSTTKLILAVYFVVLTKANEIPNISPAMPASTMSLRLVNRWLMYELMS